MGQSFNFSRPDNSITDLEVFIGNNAKNVGIRIDDYVEIGSPEQKINFIGGLSNSTNFVLPIQSLTSSISSSSNNTRNCVFILDAIFTGRGSSLTFGLPQSPYEGQMMILLRKSWNLVTLTVQAAAGDEIRLRGTTQSVTSFNIPFQIGSLQYFNAHLLYSQGTWWLIKFGSDDIFISGGV